MAVGKIRCPWVSLIYSLKMPMGKSYIFIKDAMGKSYIFIKDGLIYSLKIMGKSYIFIKDDHG